MPEVRHDIAIKVSPNNAPIHAIDRLVLGLSHPDIEARKEDPNQIPKMWQLYDSFHRLLLVHGESHDQINTTGGFDLSVRRPLEKKHNLDLQRQGSQVLIVPDDPGLVRRVSLDSLLPLASRMDSQKDWKPAAASFEHIDVSLDRGGEHKTFVMTPIDVFQTSNVNARKEKYVPDQEELADLQEVAGFLEQRYSDPKKETIWIPPGEIEADIYLWPDKAYGGMIAGMFGDMIKRMQAYTGDESI
jgi:hypothetical protein